MKRVQGVLKLWETDKLKKKCQKLVKKFHGGNFTYPQQVHIIKNGPDFFH
jgi:hypothetical protein